MRNYVIINGVNSLDIQGLAINNLPPITKPMIRTQREEIDGRDGDIVTELGYSAYDKSMEIGLYGNFDIDAIIKYFTGEGTIVFSNEADKYYNFKILDQIDYEKLLKFKTATITFHCQPFKYPVEETPIEGEAITITGSGSNITLENTVVAPIEMKVKGNTSQNGTPTPTSPIPVQVVSGDNSIEVCGKNLFDKDAPNVINGYINSLGEIIASATDRTLWIPINKNTEYTIKMTAKAISTSRYSDDFKIGLFNTQPAIGVSSTLIYNKAPGAGVDYTHEKTFNSGDNTYVGIKVCNTTRTDYTSSLDTLIIVVGTDTTYEEYTGASYPISLGVENLWNNDIQTFSNQSRMNKIIKNDNGVWMFEITQSDGYSFAHSTFTLPAGTYTVTADVDNGDFLILKGSTTQTIPFTLTEETQLTFRIYKNGVVGDVITLSNVKIAKGNSTDSVRKTPIELCKIGTYQDKIFKNTPNTTDYDSNLEDNVWYLKKEIGKVVLNGSETWQNTYGESLFGFELPYKKIDMSSLSYNNYYTLNNIQSGLNAGLSNGQYTIQLNIAVSVIYIKNTNYTTTNDFKNWLSTHNTIVYYPIETPTYETITDTTLLSQLEALKPYSYNPTTNITQINNDAPFELDVSLSYTNTMNVNNVGNIYAKPILTIEGSGTIGIILNDIEVLSVDLGTDEKITIDVPNLQAYNPDDNVLLNRNVTGDYMKLLINDGDNTIAFSGSVTSATLTNYTRWI